MNAEDSVQSKLLYALYSLVFEKVFKGMFFEIPYSFHGEQTNPIEGRMYRCKKGMLKEHNEKIILTVLFYDPDLFPQQDVEFFEKAVQQNAVEIWIIILHSNSKSPTLLFFVWGIGENQIAVRIVCVIELSDGVFSCE